MIPADKLAELKTKHGKALFLYSIGEGEDQVDFAFRKATGAEYRRHSMRVNEDKQNLFDANEELLKACVLYPEKAPLESILDDSPGLVHDVAGEILLIAARNAKVSAKKA